MSSNGPVEVVDLPIQVITQSDVRASIRRALAIIGQILAANRSDTG